MNLQARKMARGTPSKPCVKTLIFAVGIEARVINANCGLKETFVISRTRRDAWQMPRIYFATDLHTAPKRLDHLMGMSMDNIGERKP